MCKSNKITVSHLAVLVFLLCSYIGVYAENGSYNSEKQKSDTVKIGQIIPDNNIFEIRNFQKKTVKLSDFKGKLIILDFWSTWCLSCIQAMPEMEKIQNQFKGKIQVILVTKDNQKAISNLRTKIVSNSRLPMIIGDTVLSKMFVFQTVPTHVWIDSSGRVVQITDGYNTSAKNIESFLDGTNLKLEFKHDKFKWYSGIPLWLAENGAMAHHLEYYSYFMNYVDEIGKSGVDYLRDSVSNKLTGISVVNVATASLFGYAFDGDSLDTYTFPNRVIFEVKDSEKYVYPKDMEKMDDWKISNLHTYELKVPPFESAQIFDIMKEDLDRFFGVQSKIEKRSVKCLVLKRISQEDKIHSKGGTSYSRSEASGAKYSIHNRPIGNSLLHALGYVNNSLSTPVIDDTGYTGNIDIDVNCKLSDISSVRKELQKYGLDLVEEYKLINMLLITDNDLPGL